MEIFGLDSDSLEAIAATPFPSSEHDLSGMVTIMSAWYR